MKESYIESLKESILDLEVERCHTGLFQFVRRYEINRLIDHFSKQLDDELKKGKV